MAMAAENSSKGRNPLAVVSPRGKVPLAKPCKLVALAVCLLVVTLFMLQNVYVWCEEPSHRLEGGAAEGFNASSSSSSSPGTIKALLCIASQRYTGMNTASAEFFQSLKSALNCGEREGSSSGKDGDDEVGDILSSEDGEPNVRSWKSQWFQRNLSVESKPPEALRDMLEAVQLQTVDTRHIPSSIGEAAPALFRCSRMPGPVMVSLPPHAGAISCPVLWQCKAGKESKVRALCWDPRFLDTFMPATLPTEGKLFVTPKPGEASIGNYVEHLGAFLVLEHVYSNHYAQVFDSTNLFLKGGCWEGRNQQGHPLFHNADATPVLRLELAINLCSFHANSQFHGLIELMGRVAILLPAIQALPAARLLVTKFDYPFVSVFFQMLGFPAGLDGFNVQLLQERELAYADRMLVAQSPGCGHASGSVWRHIRSRYFKLRLDGRTLLEKEEHWYVVLAERKATRSIVQHQELLAGLVAALGEARVKVFSDRVKWSMADTQKLFHWAAILVGAHGAGLSNMVFMPQLASVVEVRPSNFSNNCYHVLADALGFKYYRFDSPGVKSSSLVVDVEQVVSLVSTIVRAKGRPVQFYDELATLSRRRRLG